MKKVLIIEDDSQIQSILKTHLRNDNNEVYTAACGRVALEMTDKADFNLLIADIQSPQINGFDIGKEIRKSCNGAKKREVPIIYISNYSDSRAHSMSEEPGNNILKYSNLEDLLDYISEYKTKERVVITGIGVVAPNGIGKDEFWEANINGISGVKAVHSFDTTANSTKIAAEVSDFDPSKHMPEPIAKRADRYAQLGIAAASMAVKDSKLNIEEEDTNRIGVCIGTGLGGILFHEEQIARIVAKGPVSVNPLCVPKITPNAVTSQIAIMFGLRGINLAISTACASSTNAIGQALDMIRLKRADVMITGGTEAPITPFTFAAYDSLRVLSKKRNNQPQKASRPFDNDRDGFVLGEGSGVLILENLEHARTRGAHIYAELIGYGTASGAYHMVMPEPTGVDAARAMELALKDADIRLEDVNYINAHGTSTKLNDKAETQAIESVFGKHAYGIPVSSTKSMIGHLVGAAGSVGAIICALVIENGIIPPTINYEQADPECDLDYVPNEARTSKVNIALSNSFGFGNSNASILLSNYKESYPKTLCMLRNRG